MGGFLFQGRTEEVLSQCATHQTLKVERFIYDEGGMRDLHKRHGAVFPRMGYLFIGFASREKLLNGERELQGWLTMLRSFIANPSMLAAVHPDSDHRAVIAKWDDTEDEPLGG
ncbi:hypothetical protein [Gemmatimonas groenlandica]|uniref:Uncharacterized protein n=1 Tax=Gemmatimonas groenlandica TaxID=2732249 RepID=A0A6M4INZ1_9BACT|nr:hypothetical protein [Gemmatimonas groenlandica]QJR35227.1 hypothetical protein HKW67_06770 [Gemmatimonas groenlandica]